MVEKIEKENKKYYKCENCDLHYREKDLANQCEEWCLENKNCNLDIAVNSVII